MGNPLHYSLELPQRCLQLIEELWPYAQKTRQIGHPELGPLTTTFLISMSMPIINLPIERIERYKNEGKQGYADDRRANVRLAEAVIAVLGGHSLKEAPFFIPGTWSYAKRGEASLFNIAQPIPEDLAEELNSARALESAAQMPTSQWCGVLRNAMAHGGIAYLDQSGRSSFGQPVKMFAFISGRYSSPEEPKKLIGLNALRISELDYHAFLHKWIAWLQASGLAKQVAA